MPVLIGFCVLLGCKSETRSPLETSRVTGASMSPTIWGDRARLVCGDCKIEFTANWQPEMRPKMVPPCWNCGGQLRMDKLVVEPGQTISIDTEAYRVDRPQIGDVVVIGDSMGTRVKRIVATPGQTVSLREGLLLCDEQPPSVDTPWMIVHSDSHRFGNESWWEASNVAWSKTNSGFAIDVEEENAQASILVYGHRSPYQGLRSDVVRDDYPGNLIETRQLREVTRLGLNFDLDAHSSTMIELWNWTANGVRLDQQSFEPGSYRVSTRWANAMVHRKPPIELDAEHPIGIRVTKGAITVHKLIVERPLIYWVDETRSRSLTFPIQLGKEEYFVIGDNLPLSIDSRHSGAIAGSSILGKVFHNATRGRGIHRNLSTRLRFGL